jgi:hypothetical protein
MIAFLAVAVSASAFDYSHYYDWEEAQGAFYNNLELGVDGLAAFVSGAPGVITGFHMDWNMTFVPLPSAFHFDMNMGALGDSLLVVFGLGLEPFDLLGQNNTLGGGVVFAVDSSSSSSYVGPYGRWVYRIATDAVSDGIFFDVMFHADVGYAFSLDGEPSIPVLRAGVSVGMITVTQDSYY